MDSPQLLHAAAVYILLGISWTLQVVVYPGLQYVEPTRWTRLHRAQSRGMFLITLPLMVLELLTVAQLYWDKRESIPLALGTLCIITWLITIIGLMPIYGSLVHRPVESLIQRLTLRGWLRTLVWTTSALIVSMSLIKEL